MARTTACLAAVAVLWSSACGGADRTTEADVATSPVAGYGFTGLADLAPLLPGRHPEVTADGQNVVAYSGTDYSLSDAETFLAVSTDGGRSFTSAPTEVTLYMPGVVVHGTGAVVVGMNCTAPLAKGDESTCEGTDVGLEAYVLDLQTGKIEAVPPPPASGFIVDSIGHTSEASLFQLARDEGPAILALSDSGTWSVNPLPDDTARVCVADDRVTAVTNGSPIDAGGSSPLPGEEGQDLGGVPATSPAGALAAVGPGEALWAAQVSPDAGATWSAPTAFLSERAQDFGFAVGVSCGPFTVAVFTRQLGVLSADGRTWLHVDMPPASPVGPGVAAAWRSAGELRLWSSPEVAAGPEAPMSSTSDATTVTPEAAPEIASRYIDISFDPEVIGRDPDARGQGTAAPTAGVPPQVLRGAGAEAHGYVLSAASTSALGKVP